MDAIKQFWLERAPRERLILGAGGIVLIAVLLYLMLIEPSMERHWPARAFPAAAARSGRRTRNPCWARSRG